MLLSRFLTACCLLLVHLFYDVPPLPPFSNIQLYLKGVFSCVILLMVLHSQCQIINDIKTVYKQYVNVLDEEFYATGVGGITRSIGNIAGTSSLKRRGAWMRL
jgi:hypothetical protein